MQSNAHTQSSAKSASIVSAIAFRPLPARPQIVQATSDKDDEAQARGAAELLLITRLLADDAAAWRQFTQEYAPVIIGCIRRVLSKFSRVTNDHDVDEVYARFCCELVSGDRRKLRRFDPERGSKLSTWMGMLASNATYDYLRRLKRHRLCDPMPETDILRSTEESPEGQVVMRERAQMAAAILDELSERDRQFVELYFGEGLEAEEVSALMGISVKTVYSKKHKITARLEKLVQETCAA